MDQEEDSFGEFVDTDVEDSTLDTSFNAEKENVPSEVLVDVDALNLCDLAQSIYEEPLDSSMSEEELQIVMNSTVNTKSYEKNRTGVEARFFDTLDRFGGEQIRKLALFAQDGFKKERLFYIKLRGERTEEKRFVLNKCLVMIAFKWRNNRKHDTNYRSHLQPSTWEKLMKYLFSIFRKKNINYNFLTDFNGDGEFHSVLTAQWAKERQHDPKFATGVGTSSFDMDADLKIRQLYQDKKFDPFSTATTDAAFRDRLKYAIFVLGRYFLLRGRTEIAYCSWSQVKFQELFVNGDKEEFVEISHKWDKSHKCTLSNTKPRDATDVCPRIYANANDDLCPHRFLLFLKSLCLPTQERVLCNAASKKMLQQYEAKLVSHMYNEKLPIGPNTVGPICKQMAKEMGFSDWEKCTGHGLRKMGITHAMTNAEKNIAPLILGMSRHKNYQTSLAYQKPNRDMYESYNKAILGKHVPSPPMTRKRIKLHNKEHSPLNNVKQQESSDIKQTTTSSVIVSNNGDVIGSANEVRVHDGNSCVTVSAPATATVNPPNEVETHNNGSVGSGRVSSISGLVTEEYDQVTIDGMAMVPVEPARNNYIFPYRGMVGNSLFNHTESNIQRNIIMHPSTVTNYVGSTQYYLEAELSRNSDDKKRLEDQVKALQFSLEQQKQMYQEIKQDLKESKKEANQGGKQIVVGNCILL
jgi:hypothetical protein